MSGAKKRALDIVLSDDEIEEIEEVEDTKRTENVEDIEDVLDDIEDVLDDVEDDPNETKTDGELALESAPRVEESSGKWELWSDSGERWSDHLDECAKKDGLAHRKQPRSKMVMDYDVVSACGRMVIAWERKDMPDFLHSVIHDTRYTDQADRLMKSGVPIVGFLIVGDKRSIKDEEHRKALTTAESRLMLAHRTLRIANITSDVYLYDFLCTQVRCGMLYFGGVEWLQGCPLASDAAHKAKKKCVETQEDAFFVQLCVLNRVTPPCAEAITRVYRCWDELLRAYKALNVSGLDEDRLSLAATKKLDKERCRMLENIRYGEKNRRIGPALSAKIYQTTVRLVPK